MRRKPYDFATALRTNQKDTRADRINGCCIHECQDCGHIWIPDRWVIQFCPECRSFNLMVKVEETNMPDDYTKLSTKGKPRIVSVGGKIIQLCSEPGEPLIDVSKLPKIDCVAAQLANVNRFNGATVSLRGDKIFSYNVAQHSCLVADIVMSQLDSGWPRRLVLPALMHDVPEIVYGDIVTGIKNSVGMAMTGFLTKIDSLVMNRYLGPLGYKYPLPDEDHGKIDAVDKFCVRFEAEILLPAGSRPSDDPESWGMKAGDDSFTSDEVTAMKLLTPEGFCWSRDKSRDEFIARVSREVKYLKGLKK